MESGQSGSSMRALLLSLQILKTELTEKFLLPALDLFLKDLDEVFTFRSSRWMPAN